MQAGIDVVAAFDVWHCAVEVYRRNVGPHATAVDLKDIHSVGPLIAAMKPALVAGGSPCQDFSSAGKRVEGENAALLRDFAMHVSVAMPEWFLLEQVPGARKSRAWSDAREIVVRAGYGLTEIVLNAAYYGVPQWRKRMFVIGRLGEADGFLESALRNAASDRPMTVRDCLGDEVGDCHYVHPRYHGRRGVHSTDDPSPAVRNARRPQPDSYVPHPNDANVIRCGAFFQRPYYGGRGVRSVDEPALTVIRTSRERPRPGYLSNPHPRDPAPASKVPTLTRAQVARIQGFPPDWDWTPAPRSRDKDQLIANAAPIPLVEAVGREIMRRAAGETIPAILGRFHQWLARRGLSRQGVLNVKTRVNRARRLLSGRTFAEPAAELAALEQAEGFKRLPVKTKSDLRCAIRLYAEWRSLPPVARRPKASPARPERQMRAA